LSSFETDSAPVAARGKAHLVEDGNSWMVQVRATTFGGIGVTRDMGASPWTAPDALIGFCERSKASAPGFAKLFQRQHSMAFLSRLLADQRGGGATYGKPPVPGIRRDRGAGCTSCEAIGFAANTPVKQVIARRTRCSGTGCTVLKPGRDEMLPAVEPGIDGPLARTDQRQGYGKHRQHGGNSGMRR